MKLKLRDDLENTLFIDNKEELKEIIRGVEI